MSKKPKKFFDDKQACFLLGLCELYRKELQTIFDNFRFKLTRQQKNTIDRIFFYLDSLIVFLKNFTNE